MTGFAAGLVRKRARLRPQAVRRRIMIRIQPDARARLIAFARTYGILNTDGRVRWTETCRLLMVAALTANAPDSVRLQIALRIALIFLASYVGRELAYEFRAVGPAQKKAQRAERPGNPTIGVSLDDWLHAQLGYFVRTNMDRFRNERGDLLDTAAVAYLINAGLSDPRLHVLGAGYQRETAALRAELGYAHAMMREALHKSVQRWATSLGGHEAPEATMEAVA